MEPEVGSGSCGCEVLCCGLFLNIELSSGRPISLWTLLKLCLCGLGRDSRQQQSRAPGWMCLFGADVCLSCPFHFHLLETGTCRDCDLAHVIAHITSADLAGELRGRRRTLGIPAVHNPLTSPGQEGHSQALQQPCSGRRAQLKEERCLLASRMSVPC